LGFFTLLDILFGKSLYNWAIGIITLEEEISGERRVNLAQYKENGVRGW